MKSMKKAVVLLLCVGAIAAASVFGTMAYFTSQTESVENTFTVGNVTITLDEVKVNEYGNPIYDADPSESEKWEEVTDSTTQTSPRVLKNEYKLLPGHTYTKDPTIHVDTNSEDCYLVAKVVNPISAIEAEGDTTIAKQMAAKGWTAIEGETGYYAYNNKVSAGEDVVVFDSFKIGGSHDATDLASYSGKQITVTAYAIQADGFNSAANAWTAAKEVGNITVQ